MFGGRGWVALLFLVGLLAIAGIGWGLGMARSPQVVAEPSASPTPTPTARPTPIATPVATPTATPNPTPTGERLTVLVIGTDSSAIRRAAGLGLNADAMHVISLSPDRSEVAIISLPRDTVDIPMPDGTLWTGKVNSIYGVLGAESVRGALETLYGIEIDRYLALDMDDFVRIVDAIGGIDVTLPEGIYDPSTDWGLAAGTHHLDGETTLMFVRTRYGDGDYARSARQQQVLAALRDRLLSPDEPVDVAALMDGLGSLDTDLRPPDYATLAEAALRAGDAELTTLVLKPPRFALFEGIEASSRGWVMIPNVDEIRAAVLALIGD